MTIKILKKDDDKITIKDDDKITKKSLPIKSIELKMQIFTIPPRQKNLL